MLDRTRAAVKGCGCQARKVNMPVRPKDACRSRQGRNDDGGRQVPPSPCLFLRCGAPL